MFNGKPPFSAFIRSAAEGIKKHCLPLSNDIARTKNFYVIHLRGSDRPCIVELMTSFYLIRKIESFNITKNDVIYLMTDLGKDHDNVTSLKRHFGDSLFMASDMKIFSKSPFKEDNYIVFATELALQKMSDGFLSTYKNHGKLRENNKMGSLMNMNCMINTMSDMKPARRRQLRARYRVFRRKKVSLKFYKGSNRLLYAT